MADDAELKKVQDELKKLQEENAGLKSAKGQAELDKAIAEAQRAVFVARMPPSEVKPLEGKVSLDAAVTPIQKLAHKAMSGAAEKMAADIAKLTLNTVVIHNEADVAAVARYRSVMGQIELLRDGYDAADGGAAVGPTPDAAAAAAPLIFGPALAGAAVKSVIDLLALFRTNVDIKGSAVTFEDASVVAETAKRLRAKKPDLKILYPTLIPAGSVTTLDVNASEMLTGLRALATTRQRALAEVASFEARTEDEKKANPTEGARVVSLKALNAGYDQLLAGIAQAGDATQTPSLSLLLRGEALAQRMASEGVAILYVKAVGGGESLVKQNLLRSRLSHRGTSILTYLLFDKSGELLQSNVYAESTDCEKFDV
jgi:hypothetical protein